MEIQTVQNRRSYRKGDAVFGDVRRSARRQSGLAMLLRYHPGIVFGACVTMLVSIVCISLLLFHAGPSVKAETEHPLHKYYTCVEIQPGDTLWEIAQTYPTTTSGNLKQAVQEIRELNHIEGDQITSGCYLTIPYYAESPMQTDAL